MDRTISRSDDLTSIITLSRFALVVTVYYGFGWLGLQYANIVSNITLIWIPAGIAVAAMFRWGKMMVPAIFAGAFLVILTFDSTVLMAASIAAGKTFGALLTVVLLKRFHFNSEFKRKKDFGVYIFSAMSGMLFSATCGVFLLWFNGSLAASEVVYAWAIWWSGNFAGILLAATLLLSISRKNIERATNHPWEAGIYGIVFFSLIELGFFFHQSWLFFPLLALLSSFLLFVILKYGAFWFSLSSTILVLCAIAASNAGHAVLEVNYADQSFLLIWSYVVILMVFSLMIIAADAENRFKTESLYWQERALGAISQGVMVAGVDHIVTYVNRGFEKITGYNQTEILGSAGTILHGPDTNPETAKEIRDAFGSWQSFSGEILNYRKDGTAFFNDLSISPVFDNNGNAVQFICVLRDITERKQLDRELRVGAIALEAQEGIIITDQDGVIIKVNKAFSRITGFESGEAVGKTPSILNSGRQNKAFYESMWNALIHHGRWQGEIWNKRKNGELYPQYLTISAVTDDEGATENYVGIFTDISLAKDAESTIQRLAFYDTLTELPNRRLFLDRLNQSLVSSQRHKHFGALLYIDLDDFKMVNDFKGHRAGDLLLVKVARRLELCVRAVDTVARLGGDEFVILLEELNPDEALAAIIAENIAEKILVSVKQPFSIESHVCHISSSVGISLIPNYHTSADEVLMRADSAMYQAKKSGRNSLRFFDPVMQQALQSRMQLESLMRSSLNRHFLLYYQIQVNRFGNSIGAEALIRWHHPEKGMIVPSEFIPLAEENGMIVSIGQWVLETACAQLKAWESDEMFKNMQLAVNVSSRQFQQHDYVQQVLETIHKYKLAAPNRLKLELTESAVLKNMQDTISKMAELKAVGIRFSMDDFGTGYSSLAYLTQFEFDQIKIDKSFILDMHDKVSNKVIVQTIIGMGHNLGMEVIAEGVETDDQRAFLLANNCDAFQGYLFGKPLPLDEFTKCILAG